MSGKAARRRRREIREKTEEMIEDMKQLEGEGMKTGMSIDQVVELARASAIQIRTELTRVGAVDSMPWGVVGDPASVTISLHQSVAQIEKAFEAIDKIDIDASAEEHVQVLAGLAQSLMGTAGCAILLLQSSPLPYDLIKHFIVRKTEGEPNAD